MLWKAEGLTITTPVNGNCIAASNFNTPGKTYKISLEGELGIN
jgi:hypothetical protein